MAGPSITFREIEGRGGFYALLAACGAVLLLGAYAYFQMEHHGHVITGMDNQMVWGMPHVIALFLIVAASGALNHAVLPALVPSPLAFAVAGMAAFFTATIRAPLTGIVICLEMTGCYSLFFPMLATCLGAYLIPTLLKDPPIYDALSAREDQKKS